MNLTSKTNKVYKGQTNALAVAMVVMAIGLIIGIYVVAQLQLALGAELSCNVTATPAVCVPYTKINSTFSVTYTSFGLAAIGLIVMAAFTIINGMRTQA